MKTYLCIICLAICCRMSASDFYFPAGPVSGGISHASVADVRFWSVINNPAIAAFVESVTAGINYESRFNLEELSVKSVGLIYPGSFGVVTSGFQYYGYDIYNEIRYTLGYSRKFGAKIGASVQFDLLSNRANPEVKSAYTLTANAALFIRFSKQFDLGFFIFNLPSSQFKGREAEEQIPTIYRIGFNWHPVDRLQFLSEMRGKSGETPVFCGGVNYQFIEDFSFQAGLGSNPATISFGASYSKWGLSFGLSCMMVKQIGKVWNGGINYAF